jgi:hypothetical protein
LNQSLSPDGSDEGGEEWTEQLKKMKKEDILVKLPGDGHVILCFLWPRKEAAGAKSPLAPSPTLSPEAMRQFIVSPYFRGRAQLK